MAETKSKFRKSIETARLVAMIVVCAYWLSGGFIGAARMAPSQMGAATILLVVSAANHAFGVTLLMWFFLLHRPEDHKQFEFWRSVGLTLFLASALMVLHMQEIAYWAHFYQLIGVWPDYETCLYYSLSTYTTLGYGDLVLPRRWRLVGGIESVTGILMFGWSTGFFFAVMSKVYDLNMVRLSSVRKQEIKEQA